MVISYYHNTISSVFVCYKLKFIDIFGNIYLLIILSQSLLVVIKQNTIVLAETCYFLYYLQYMRRW